jgi:hypothetical protein
VPGCADPAGGDLPALQRRPARLLRLNVNGPALVQVTVLSHTVSGAQAQVRLPLKPGFVCPGNGDDPVNSTDRIGAFGVVPSGGGNTQFVVDLPPGNAQYYIRVSLPSAGNGQPYYLRWEFISANGAPATRDPVLLQPQPALPAALQRRYADQHAPGGTAVYYWSGMRGLWPYDSINQRHQHAGRLPNRQSSGNRPQHLRQHLGFGGDGAARPMGRPVQRDRRLRDQNSHHAGQRAEVLRRKAAEGWMRVVRLSVDAACIYQQGQPSTKLCCQRRWGGRWYCRRPPRIGHECARIWVHPPIRARAARLPYRSVAPCAHPTPA